MPSCLEKKRKTMNRTKLLCQDKPKRLLSPAFTCRLLYTLLFKEIYYVYCFPTYL